MAAKTNRASKVAATVFGVIALLLLVTVTVMGLMLGSSNSSVVDDSISETLDSEEPEQEHIHEYSFYVSKEPTCLDNGQLTYICSCGDSYTESSPSLGHNYQEETILEPTCGKAGTVQKTCSRCGDIIYEDIRPTGEHNFDTWEDILDPTCQQTGERVFTCSECSATYSQTLDTIDHEYILDESKDNSEPTCTECGHTYYKCSMCNAEYIKTTEPLGHEYNEGVVTKEATCLEDGVKTYTCIRCYTTYTEPIYSSGAHSFDEGTVLAEPTCTNEGIILYTCSNCNSYYTESINPLGHSYIETVTKEPTCVEMGVKTYTCSTCGHSYTKEFTDSNVAHQYELEYDEYGHYQECVLCGDITESVNHTYSGTYTNCEDGLHHVKACTECGYRVKELHEVANESGACIYCNETGLFTGGEYITYTDIDDTNTCYVSYYNVTGCTEEALFIPYTHENKTVVGIGTPEASGSGSAAFKGSTGSSDNNYLKFVSIPSGVTAINPYVFYNCYSLTSINIPSSVTEIGNYAFYNCYSLTSINIPSSVTEIGNYTFYNCYSLTSINISSGVTSIGTSAFRDCYSLASVNFSSDSQLESISDYAFHYCYTLASIVIPSGVTSIGNSFSYCYALASIVIPSGVTSIGNSTFGYCYSLASVNFSSDSQLESISNYAFSYCYALASIVIPSGVTEIGDYAFRDCYSLASVNFSSDSQLESIGDNTFQYCYALASIVIPSGVTEIGTYAFRYCYALASVVIPKSVTSIGKNAFYNCYSLTRVYYMGSPSEWSSIGINSSNNSYLTNADRYYYDENGSKPYDTEGGSTYQYWHYDEDGNPVIWTN